MMQITAALAGARMAAGMLGQLFQKSPHAEAVDAGPPAALGGGPAAGSESAGALRQIAARYDVSDISPAEVSNLLQELHQAGLLSDGQYHELSQIRLDLDAAGVEADDRVDLLDFYAEKLEALAESAPGMPAAQVASAMQPLEGRHGWLQKVALLQSSAGNTSALDALA